MRVACVAFLVVFLASNVFAANVPVAVGPGFSFTPANVTVAPGDTVVWTFFGTHTSTGDSLAAAEVWNSGVLSSGMFSHTFNTPGTYPYYCAVHSVPGGTFMNGSVKVTPLVSALSITGVAPINGLPGTTLTITGTGFQSGATVSFGGTLSPTVTFMSATTLQAVVPNIPTGAATIVVTNPDTTSASFTGFNVASLAIPALSREMMMLLAMVLVTIGAAIIRTHP